MSTTTFNWSDPLTLSLTSANSSDAKIAIDLNGNVVAVWVENTFIKSSSKSINSNWTSPVILSNSGSSAPGLVIDANGNSTAIWVENGIIKVSSKTLTGSWLSSTTLSTTNTSSPTIAVDIVGNVVTAWVKANNIQSSTKLFGMPWRNKITITSNGASSPHIALGGFGTKTRAVIVWHSTSTNLIYASTKLLTGNWSTQQVISDTFRTSMCAKVAVDSNANATTIWYAYTLTGNVYSDVVVQSSCRSNSTGTWSPITNLSSAGIYNPNDLNANIKFDGNGNAIAIWNTSFDGSIFNIQSAIKPVREKWSSVIDIVDSLYSFKSDIDVISHGNGLSAFMFYNGSSLLILTSEINISGHSIPKWEVPINVSLGTNNGFPRIATSITDNNINAAIIWLQFNGSHNIVQASTGSQSLVLPPTNLLIAQYSNNFGIFTEYYNSLQWTASTDPNVIGYAIFRNGKFINQTPANATHYIDNNQIQNGFVTYGIATINNQNMQSKIIIANFP